MTDSRATPAAWFTYPIRVQPHHTDYGGVVWHGTYITWMESARVECLRTVGVPFECLVDLGYDLPVVDLQLRYRQALTLGMDAVVKTRLAPVKGIRLNWLYEIETFGSATQAPQLCLSGQVTLVTVDTARRQIVRRLPNEVKTLVDKVTQSFGIVEKD